MGRDPVAMPEHHYSPLVGAARLPGMPMPSEHASYLRLQRGGGEEPSKFLSPSLGEKKRKKPWRIKKSRRKIGRKSQSKTQMTAWTAAAAVADAGMKTGRSRASSLLTEAYSE